MTDQTPTSPPASPLAEADPDSINELLQKRLPVIFNLKPLDLTDTDVDLQVEYYRRERARVKVEQDSKPPRSARGKTAPKSVAEALAAHKDVVDDL